MENNFFDKIPNRLDTNSFKWDYRHVYFGDNEIFPLHVADMDFLSSPPIIEAMQKRLNKNFFGYSVNSPEHFIFLAKWIKKRHNYKIQPGWCLHSPSAVSSIAIIINCLTQEGQGIIVQTPSYPPFLSSVLNFKRKLLINELIEKDSYYTIDYDDFEKKCKEGAKLFIFCSPHNPTGRVWRKEEVKKLTDICMQYNVLIISDELHADLVYKHNVHIPTASISEEVSHNTFTLYSPSKTFNIAGLSASCVVIPNKNHRKLIEAEFEKFHLYIPNSMGLIAFDAAYTHGEEWYQALIQYLFLNKKLCEDFFAENFPHISIVKPEGTYLLWINFKNLNMQDKELKNYFHKKLKLGLEPGLKFGQGGEGFMRLNFALPVSQLKEVLLKLASPIPIPINAHS